jgi:uncharacterized membrane protein
VPTPDHRLLIALFTGSGLLHLGRPEVFEPIIPAPLRRWDRVLVLASGGVELACAAGLAHPRSRPAAGLASAALLVAVWPANVQMTLAHGRRARRRGDLGSAVVWAGTLVRLPLQWPLIRIALRSGREGVPRRLP